MTGEDVGNLLTNQLGEFGLGYFDATRQNDFLFKSITDIIDKKVEEFQQTQKVTREMQPFITTTTSLTPVSSNIDLSATSAQVPDYYSPIKLQVTSPYKDGSLVKYAKERRHDQFVDNYTEGTARYPRYVMGSGIMTLEPANATACIFTYFNIPFYIDVADNSIQVPYNNKLIQKIIDGAIEAIGFEERDEFTVASAGAMVKNNP